PRGITETVLAQTHTQAKKIRAERNVWGDKVTIPGGPVEQFLPWKRRAEKADKRDKEIWRLGNKDMMPFPGMPSKNFELDEFTKRHLGVKEDIVKL
ncbi:MAG: hypothetical protein GWN62_12980, partial [Aliifodinibius sp.]|nr:hypothetical protein [Fodinibius sp.]